MVADYDVERHSKDIQAKLNRFPSEDVELNGDFQKYLCIRINAHYEQSVKQYLLKYIANKSKGQLSRLAEKRILKRQSSFEFDQLCKLLDDFEHSLKEEFKKKIESETKDSTKDSINALIKNRNKLAHGENTDIGLDTLRTCFETVQALLTVLFTLLELDKNVAVRRL